MELFAQHKYDTSVLENLEHFHVVCSRVLNVYITTHLQGPVNLVFK